MNNTTDTVRAQAWAKLERQWAIDGMPSDKIRLARAAFDAGAALAPQPAIPEGWPKASARETESGWALDYGFVCRVQKLAEERDGSVSLESVEAILCAGLEVHRLNLASAIPEGDWLTACGNDPRVNVDSYAEAIEAARSHIGAERPDDDEPEEQWFWDKLTALLEIAQPSRAAP